MSPLSSYSARLTDISGKVEKLAIIDPPRFKSELTNPSGILSVRVSIHSNPIYVGHILSLDLDIAL